MNQQEVWDKIAKPWSEYRQRAPQETLDFIKNKKGKVLDLGCGSGRNLVAKNNIEYYGVDFSSEMLKLAEENSKKLGLKAVFFKSDIGKEKLPFKDNFFDSAVFISTLHCIESAESRENALNELYRVIKPGSEVMISVWKKEAMISAWKKELKFGFNSSDAKEIFVNWKNNGKNYQRYYYFYNQDELKKLIKMAGFKIIVKRLKNDSKHGSKNIIFYVKK